MYKMLFASSSNFCLKVYFFWYSQSVFGYHFYDILFTRAAITKFHRLGVLSNRDLFSHSSGALNSKNFKVKVLSGLTSSEGHEGRNCSRPLSLACQWLSFPVFSYHLPSVYIWTQIFSSCKDISHTGLGHILVMSF